MGLDPDRLQAVTGALFGGVFWAMVHLAAALLNGQPPDRRDVVLALANAALGVAAGAMAAWVLAPAVAPLIPNALASLRDLHAVGFGFGALSWVAAPFLIKGVEAFGKRKIGEIGE